MKFTLPGYSALAATLLLACSSAYKPPDNSYPGGGGNGGNGSFGGGGVGGYTSGGSGSGSGTGTSSGTSGGTTSGGTSGGSSSGGTTGSSPNQLNGPLAFPVASAAQYLPVVVDGGVVSQMEFDLASFVIDCNGVDGGVASQAGQTLALTLYSGSSTAAVTSGPYYVLFPAPGPNVPYAAATLFQTDAFGQVSVVATAQSGPVIWSPSFSGTASGTLTLVMSSSGGGTTVLSGSFVAPYCGPL
jgi:hypothetical protein